MPILAFDANKKREHISFINHNANLGLTSTFYHHQVDLSIATHNFQRTNCSTFTQIILLIL